MRSRKDPQILLSPRPAHKHLRVRLEVQSRRTMLEFCHQPSFVDNNLLSHVHI